jgi:hypothetical protein
MKPMAAMPDALEIQLHLWRLYIMGDGAGAVLKAAQPVL